MRHEEIIVFLLVVLNDLILWKNTVWYQGVVGSIQYQLTCGANSRIGHRQNARQRVSGRQRWSHVRWRSVEDTTLYVSTDSSQIRKEVGFGCTPTLSGRGTSGSC